MKTTSYEISEKLKNIGFNAKAEFYWVKRDDIFGYFHISQECDLPDSLIKYSSFDLETILSALPSEYSIEISKNGICLDKYTDKGRTIDFRSKVRKKNESLADTAARLLLLLESKGLVKFNN
jgi:hypothetical protein